MAKIGEAVLERAGSAGSATVAEFPGWPRLAEAVELLRTVQAKDGSVGPGEGNLETARTAADAIAEAVAELSPAFPHDAEYHEALLADLRRWAAEGFGTPDFLDSLLAFRPETQRVDGLRHLVVFPMYTQNGNPNRNFEAVLLRVFWPDWLAALEADRYDNPGFLSISFEAFTAGYDTNSAVLFPETVAVREVPKFSWGAIFSDREAARFRTVTTAAAEATRLELPEDVARLIEDQDLAQDAFAAWDMIHDRTHSHGDLPFDPFMIKQRMPFFLYTLEEMRCDLTAFRECVRIEQALTARAEAGERPVPAWLEVIPERMRILVHVLPVRAQIDTQVQEQLIVEYYSK